MRRNPESLHFDLYAFDPRYRAAWRSQRMLAYSDTVRMGVERHPTIAKGRETPEWLHDNRKIKQVISQALAGHDTETLDELHTAAHERWRKWFRWNWHSREGRRRYIAVQANGGIERLYAKLIWQWRIGRNSRDMAEATGMSRVACRQILHRMNVIGTRLFPSSS
jgi:hypothetical protein